MTTIEQIMAIVEHLSPDKQQKVLDFAQALAWSSQARTPLPPATPGQVLLDMLSTIKLPEEDIDAKERALEDCERIEPDDDSLSFDS